MSGPCVSVVVPTFHRPERLRRLLASLAGQDLDPAAFEIIVVDDGGDAVVPPSVRLCRCPGRGPAAARNVGWRAARGALIAFTDDDCAATPGWLQALLRAAKANPGAIVQGRTLPDPAEADRAGLLSHTVRVEALGPRYETCNIAYPRTVLEAVGGFDESYRLASPEDTDLAWRALETGARAVFVPEALVLHAVELRGLAGTLRAARRWRETPRLFARHPATRTMLYRGRFWNVWHYLLWRSVASLLLPRWARRFVVARHMLALRTRARRAGAGAWAVPFLLVHDAIECWSIAGGAIRARALVL